MDEIMIYYIIENNLKKFLESISNGANAHYKDEYPLILSASKGYIQFVSVLISVFNVNVDAQNGLALKNACVFGYFDVVLCLIENNANINIDDGSALVWSLYKSHYDIVKYLITKGAYVNIRDGLPLKICVDKGNLEMTKYLIDNGANIDINFYNDIYLKKLSETGKCSIAIYLLEKITKLREDKSL